MAARSRAAAGRYLTEAGLYAEAGQASRHLRDYGSTTGNAQELAACVVEGEVFVKDTLHNSRVLRWPQPTVTDPHRSTGTGWPVTD